MRYRSDIDGLRAIAVILVLIFHAGSDLFPSGFIGVDIFFVISGFLITEIISRSIENNSFSLSDFYIRRLWRLQPALISVVVFTLILASLFYLPDDFINYAKSLKYTTLFTSNQYFANATTAYAAQDSQYLLLLHTWSLSIEWQWYLFLPLGIYLLRKNLSGKSLKIVTSVITICMLALSLYLSSRYQNKSYYFLTSRAFEFMIGSCLVIFNHEKLRLNKKITSLLGIISLVALFYVASKRNIVVGYPDYNAVIVSLASAFLILAGTSATSIATRLLSLPPIVFIGTISYSLYLWHWPIFATGRYLGIEENITFTIFCFLLTLFLSYISYIFIEKKFRKTRRSLWVSVIPLAIIPMIFSTILYSMSKTFNGFPSRFGDKYVRIESLLNESNSKNREKCFNGIIDINNPTCTIGNIQSKNKALLIGDSNSNHFWQFFDVLGKDSNINITAISSSSCLALPKIQQYQWGTANKLNTSCYDRTNQYFNEIQSEKYDYVIIGELWSNYLSNIALSDNKRATQAEAENVIFQALDDAVNLIEKSGSKAVLVKEIAHMPNGYMECFYSPYKNRKHKIETSSRCSFAKNTPNQLIENIFLKIKQSHPDIIFIDPSEIQCNSGFCIGNIEEVPIYRDQGHLTDYASHKFGEIYLKKYKNPFIN